MSPVEQARRLRLLAHALDVLAAQADDFNERAKLGALDEFNERASFPVPDELDLSFHEASARPSFLPGPGHVYLDSSASPRLSLMNFEHFKTLFVGMPAKRAERDQYGVAWWVEFEGVTVTCVDRRGAEDAVAATAEPIIEDAIVPTPEVT